MKFQQVEVKKVKLDLKDKKILNLLCQNSRTPSTIISKKVALSRDAVSYRINNFIKNGVIQGYRTIIDISKLGYDSYHVFLQLNQPTKKVEDELIKKFKAYPFIRAILKFSGKYDFELAIIAKNIKEFDEIFDKILHDCSKYLQDYVVLIITKNYKITNTLPRSFLDIKVHQQIKKIEKNIKIDKIDKEILSLLADDASLQLYKIAEKINLSPDTVNYRLKKLINSGIIINFVPVINYAALSYSIYAVLLRINGLKDEKESTLKQFLNTDENVLWAVKTIGSYNVLIYVCVKNTEDLHKTLINLRSHFPQDIRDYETLIAYEEYKYTYFPKL